jgi:6-phosphogluconate dehydrogenase
MIGLGRMGGNIARRLMRGGHQIVAFDRNQASVDQLAAEGATAASSLEDVVAKLASPKIVWVMLPAGAPTEDTVQALIRSLGDGDIIIDGGNSFYRDDIRRSKDCAAKGIHYVDVGTSGGVWGLERGFCMMIGGSDAAFATLDPVFDCLAPGYGTVPRTPERDPNDTAPERGYLHAGPPGAGHFVKMVHNGIEYGLMQAYAEGFDVMKSRSGNAKVAEDERFDLNLTDIAEVWRRGSVISSWLLDLQATALAKDGELAAYSGKVADSGEGHWTIDAAMEQGTPVNVLAASLFARYRSRVDSTFGDKLLSAMRFGFGGHVEMPQ